MNIPQLREYVIEPVLRYLGLYSLAAENLLIGTVMVESRANYIHQLKGGPALGLFQMEPATHDDIHRNYLAYRKDLEAKVYDIAGGWQASSLANEMIGNVNYAAAMARIHYLRVPEPLPDANDVEGLAAYWKEHYNTALGAGSVQDFVNNYPSTR